ncbi:hypothetical protein AB0G15_42885 [Streptosporangium sp. NPDC023825]|uniref:hypothetical protein n=1 Tax=Streptosporangium sp. NPDC023825 TaxID=3154909 RepID=UPI003445D51C
MNIISRLGAVIEGVNLVWRDELAASVECCGVVPWCGGEHIISPSGVTHVRRVATMTRVDGTPVLAIAVRQWLGGDYTGRPVVYVETEHEENDDIGMSLGTPDVLALAQILTYVGDDGERVALTLMAAHELTLSEPVRESLTISRKWMRENLAFACA